MSFIAVIGDVHHHIALAAEGLARVEAHHRWRHRD